jgi:hypothetical protein
MRPMMRVMLAQAATTGCGFVLPHPADDEFDCGSTLDTTGGRFSGAYPWTIQNQRGGTATQAGGVLSMTVTASASPMDPLLAMQAMDAGDGAWRALVDMSIAFATNWMGVGLALREAATGKLVCCGYAYEGTLRATVRGLTSYTTWIATTNGANVADLAGYVEIVRDAGTMYYYVSEDETNWTEVLRVAQTTQFTTAADQVGLWVNYAGGGPARIGLYESFEKVIRTLPYTVPIVNPGAQTTPIVAPWTNVSNTILSRAAVGRGGTRAFAVNTVATFEAYQEQPVGTFASLIDVGAGAVTATLEGWGAPWTGSTSTFRLRLNAYDSGGVSLASASTAYWTPSAVYTQQSAPLALPVGTRTLRITYEGTNNASQDCWMDDLTLILS